MRLLVLAPQPFYQERGTPIAVRLALEVIAERVQERTQIDHHIDLLTYHEGEQLSIPGVLMHRISPPIFLSRWLSGVGPGISFKKLICDLLFFFKAISLVIQNREQRYDLVHAVEEGVFVALFIKLIWGIPYIYDMDSSMAMQVTEKWWWLRPLAWILKWFERVAIKNSMAVAPVCDALGAIAQKHGADAMVILRDVSLIQDTNSNSAISLRNEVGATREDVILLYVGNLEPYQGIELFLRSFHLIYNEHANTRVVIIGGNQQHIAQYESLSKTLGISQRVSFLGPRPIDSLGHYIADSDILVSPRIKGNNTPMKIYSYLHAGRALLATDLPTHTQVLTSEVSKLAAANPVDFSKAMLSLINDLENREQLAKNAKRLAEERYTFHNFRSSLNELYDLIDRQLLSQVRPT